MQASDAVTHAGHEGPILDGCPVRCLAWVISWHALNPLLHPSGAGAPPAPRTAGDVARYCREGALGRIGRVGPRRRSEIEAGLALAGFDITSCAPAGFVPGGDADGVLPADQARAALGRLAGRVAAGDPVAGLLGAAPEEAAARLGLVSFCAAGPGVFPAPAATASDLGRG